MSYSRLIYFTKIALPSKEANCVQTLQMCDAFAQNDIEVELIAFNTTSFKPTFEDLRKKFTISNSFNVHSINKKNNFIGIILGTFLGLLKAFQFRSNDTLFFTRDLIIAYCLHLFRFPFIYEGHRPHHHEKWHRRHFINSVVESNSCKGIVLISEALKNIYLEHLNVSESLLVALHDGANYDQKIANTLKRKPLQRKIGYFGSVRKGRGIEIICDMSSELPDYEFYIYGDGPDSDYYKHLMKDRKNVFFKGHTDHSEVFSLMSSMSFLLAPYQKDTSASGGARTINYCSPLKIFEYFASGALVLASDVGSIPEVVHNKKNGLLCDPEKSSEWIKAVTDVEKDEVLYRSIIETAINEIKTTYSWKNRANLIVNIEKN